MFLEKEITKSQNFLLNISDLDKLKMITKMAMIIAIILFYGLLFGNVFSPFISITSYIITYLYYKTEVSGITSLLWFMAATIWLFNYLFI